MAGAETEGTRNVQRVVFSSDELPAELDDRSRLQLWRETLERVYGSFEHSYAEDQPFSVRLDLLRAGSAAVAALGGSLVQAGRSARDVARNGCENYMVGINAGREPVLQRHRGREVILPPASFTLVSMAEAGDVLTSPGALLRWASVPPQRLTELVADADDLVARAVDPELPSARHLRRYLDLLLGPDGIEDDPDLHDHVAATLTDLIALCLGAGRNARTIAHMRGLRAARFQEALAVIRASFADPAFSVATVAAQLGVSERYVQDLLQEAGRSFTEHVLELRLQKARAMLASARHHSMKVSEIAYSCGFNEASYFNRCFRRRFGASPTQYRGGDRD